MCDNLVEKLIKELHKLGGSQYSAPTPEKLTRFLVFARWAAHCKDYLQNVNANAQIGAIVALLDEEIYDFAFSADILAASTHLVVLDGLREILGSSDQPWVSQSDFQRRLQQPKRVNQRLPACHSTPRSLKSSTPKSARPFCEIGRQPSTRALPWIVKIKFCRPLANNHRGRFLVSQPSSFTPPATPSHKLLGSPAPAAPLHAVTTDVGPRSDDQTGPKPAVP
ncbi:unnamed protein product [Schistocephalus solidus]|uniref:Uncharacterized protein n=1 Tax=Schistocephalus solidus TaxID=70667 RepID=A0A183SDL4_SCHSO|nr:unnamed protein product [Schistocephalus solidus]